MVIEILNLKVAHSPSKLWFETNLLEENSY